MRDLVLLHLNTGKLTGFGVSYELPYNQNGTPLYQQNYKTIYVDQPQTEQEPLLDTLDGVSIVSETTSINAYLTTDAKQLPSNYSDMLDVMKDMRIQSNVDTYRKRATTVATEYDTDSLTTTVHYNFTKTLDNT